MTLQYTPRNIGWHISTNMNSLTNMLDICICAWLDRFQGELQQGVKKRRIVVLEGMVNELWTCPEATQSILPGEKTVGPSALFHTVHQNLPC